MAGQPIATRITGDPEQGNNGLFYFLVDHLGSTTLMVTTAGVIMSTAYFLPYGGYRYPSTPPPSELTDTGFTGHKHNDSVGLIYMNARYYVPNTNRFLTPDSIIPQPADPQSYNRYSYARNNPVRYTDPTGHRTCESVTNCEIHGLQGFTAPTGALVAFEATAGLDYYDADGNKQHVDGTLETWSESEKAAIRAGAYQVGKALAGVINEDHPDWDVTASEAFLMVYGGTVTFTKVGISCASDPANSIEVCGARTTGSRSVRVYTDASEITHKEQWAVHELGHAFVYAVGSSLPVDTLRDSGNPLLKRVYSETDAQGFGSTQAHPWMWQQSDSDLESEVFADMYLGWSYSTWETSPAGVDRSEFMTSNISLWVNMAIER